MLKQVPQKRIAFPQKLIMELVIEGIIYSLKLLINIGFIRDLEHFSIINTKFYSRFQLPKSE
jgi:hypothetical protein